VTVVVAEGMVGRLLKGGGGREEGRRGREEEGGGGEKRIEERREERRVQTELNAGTAPFGLLPLLRPMKIQNCLLKIKCYILQGTLARSLQARTTVGRSLRLR
jgi:hypothetical protein